jgi:hypothetical protein
MEHLELRGITQQESDTRRKHVAHATRMIQERRLAAYRPDARTGPAIHLRRDPLHRVHADSTCLGLRALNSSGLGSQR